MKYFPNLNAAVLALSMSALALPAVADGIYVTVINNSHIPVEDFRISPTESDQWGPDHTGSATLGHGGRILVNLSNTSPSCVYDIRVVSLTSYGTQIIENHRWTSCGSGDYTIQ